MDKDRTKRIRIGNLPIDSLSTDEAINLILNNIHHKRKTTVFTPNADHIVKAHFDSGFKDIYQKVDLSLVDGMSLVWISYLYGNRLPQRINGTNLTLRLCEESIKKDFSIFLLGLDELTIKLAIRNLKKEFPELKVEGFHLDLKQIFLEERISEIILKLNFVKPHIILVAFGAPLQEKWIYRYYSLLDAYVFIGVGSALDFISGRLKRAPTWIQNMGLEWLFRLLQEPARLWKRYLIGNAIFLFLILREIIQRMFLKPIINFYGENSINKSRSDIL